VICNVGTSEIDGNLSKLVGWLCEQGGRGLPSDCSGACRREGGNRHYGGVRLVGRAERGRSGRC
jgi:hypothetical protein